jgi:UDP-N-acetylenolpyruvoylglucosamine reductase
LIIINQNNSATATDIMQLVQKVRQTVFAKTGIQLNLEPELVGFGEDEVEKYFRL